MQHLAYSFPIEFSDTWSVSILRHGLLFRGVSMVVGDTASWAALKIGSWTRPVRRPFATSFTNSPIGMVVMTSTALLEDWPADESACG